jgi:hypothetical protein
VVGRFFGFPLMTLVFLHKERLRRQAIVDSIVNGFRQESLDGIPIVEQ